MKPKNISRNDYHRMAAVARDFSQSSFVYWDGSNAVSGLCIRDEEGYKNTRVCVYLSSPGVYEVTVDTHARDCDGVMSFHQTYLVSFRKKAKRYYVSYNHKGNKPCGAFGIKVFNIKNIDSTQRDYSAEAAGY